MHTPITTVAKLIAKQEKREAALALLLELTEKSREEEGNIQYDLHESIHDKGTFTIVEQWASQKAHDAHREYAHYKVYAASASTVFEKRSAIHTHKLHNI